MSVAVVVAGVLFVLLGDPRVCRNALPEAAKEAVRVCDPPALTDVPVVALALIVLLLLAPDLGETGIAGVTVKRLAEEAKADAATARADVAAVRLTVTQQMHQAATASSTAHATTVVQAGEAAVLTALAELGLLRGADPVQRGSPDTPAAAPHRLPVAPGAEHALLLSESLDRARALLPPEWQDGTFLGVVGDLTLLAGAELPSAVLDRVLSAPTGAVASAGAGRYAVTPATKTRAAVVAAPVWSSAGSPIAVVAVVLPPGLVVPDDAAVDLAAAAAVFSPAVASLRLAGAATAAASPGPGRAQEGT
jgi:hypothetical protein